MRIDGLHGISNLSGGRRRKLESMRRSRGYLASLAFQDPSTFIHPGGACKPHPRFRRMGLSLRGTSPSLSQLEAVHCNTGYIHSLRREIHLLIPCRPAGATESEGRGICRRPILETAMRTASAEAAMFRSGDQA